MKHELIKYVLFCRAPTLDPEGPVEFSDDEVFDCSFCDQEFQLEFDLIVHKNKFHQQIPIGQRTILGEANHSKR